MKKRNLFDDELMEGVAALKQQRELDELLAERLVKVGQDSIPAEEVRENIIASLKANTSKS